MITLNFHQGPHDGERKQIDAVTPAQSWLFQDADPEGRPVAYTYELEDDRSDDLGFHYRHNGSILGHPGADGR